MKRLLIGVGITVGVVLLAAIVYLAVTDFSRYRTNLEVAISEATGRQLQIAGDFQPNVFPLSFVAEDITFANAEWGSEQPFLQIGHVSARASLSSLLSGPFTIYEFRLSDVTVLLEENDNGNGNWEIDVDDSDFEPGVEIRIEEEIDAEPVILEFAEIRNVSVIYRRPGQPDRTLSIDSLDVTQTENNFTELAAAGSLDGESLTASGSVGPRESLTNGTNIEYSLESYVGSVALDVSGKTPGASSAASFDATLTSDDITDALEMLGLSANITGPLSVEASLDPAGGTEALNVNAKAGGLTFDGSASMAGNQFTVDARLQPLNVAGEVFEIDGLPDKPLLASGTITDLPEGVALTDVSLQVEPFEVLVSGLVSNDAGTDTRFKAEFTAGSLAELGNDLPDIPLSSTVTATITKEGFGIPEFVLNFGDSDLSGTADIRLSDKPSVTAELNAELIDLSPFDPAEETTGEQQAAKTAADTTAEPEAAAKSTSQDLVFRDEALPFEFLNAGSADIKLTIDRYIRGPVQLQDVTASAGLEDGTLEADFGFSVETGGEAESTLRLVSRGESADLDFELDVTDLRLSLSDNSERSASDIPLIGVTADITSSGASPRALAAGLNGKLLFTQGPGKVDNSAMGFFSADIISELFGALNPFSKNEPYSTWECTVFALNVTDGVGVIEPMLAQSKKVKIVGDGSIDLNNEKLDISFNTEPRSGVGISADMFVTPFVRLGGTLAAPRIALDKSGILVSGGAAILTGGISFFVKGAADRASGASDRCAAALAIANGENVELED